MCCPVLGARARSRGRGARGRGRRPHGMGHPRDTHGPQPRRTDSARRPGACPGAHGRRRPGQNAQAAEGRPSCGAASGARRRRSQLGSGMMPRSVRAPERAARGRARALGAPGIAQARMRSCSPPPPRVPRPSAAQCSRSGRVASLREGCSGGRDPCVQGGGTRAPVVVGNPLVPPSGFCCRFALNRCFCLAVTSRED